MHSSHHIWHYTWNRWAHLGVQWPLATLRFTYRGFSASRVFPKVFIKKKKKEIKMEKMPQKVHERRWKSSKQQRVTQSNSETGEIARDHRISKSPLLNFRWMLTKNFPSIAQAFATTLLITVRLYSRKWSAPNGLVKPHDFVIHDGRALRTTR